MTSPAMLRLLILIFPLVSYKHVIALVLTTEPQTIEPGVTERLLINCSVPKDSGPKLAFLNSVIVSRRSDRNTETYVELALINAFTKDVAIYNGAKDDEAVASGVINNKGDSYLSLHWTFPVKRMAGEYRCEVHGMSQAWKSITYSVTQKVIAKNIDIGYVMDQLRQVKTDMAKQTSKMLELEHRLNATQKASTEFIYSLSSRIETSRNWFFKVSPVYKGRRYYLSQQDPTSKSEEAMATCVFYGGYLAEIEDVEEYNFVLAFIKQFNAFTHVLLGGTDEGHHGYWTYRHSNATVPKWLMKSRNAPNCRAMYLYSGIGWYALDDIAYHASPPHDECRFMCEIPL